MEKKYEVLMDLLKDEAVAKQLFSNSVAEVKDLLKSQYSLDFTEEELADVASGIAKAMEDENDELTEDQLVNVAGGASKSGAYTAGYYIGKTVKAVGGVYATYQAVVAIAALSW